MPTAWTTCPPTMRALWEVHQPVRSLVPATLLWMKAQSLWALLSGLWEPCRWFGTQIPHLRREKPSLLPTVSSVLGSATVKKAVASWELEKTPFPKKKEQFEYNVARLNSHSWQTFRGPALFRASRAAHRPRTHTPPIHGACCRWNGGSGLWEWRAGRKSNYRLCSAERR